MQRIRGKQLLPQPWRELIYLRRRMLSDMLQHIDEIVVLIDIVQPTGYQQALHDTDMSEAR